MLVALLASGTPTAAQGVSYAPVNGGKGVNHDTHLVITFPSPPALGTSGKIRIYDAQDDA